MPIRLFNTLTRQIEDFKPLEGNTVRMYTCGPTVYDFAHIGNYRTFLFQDVLRRYLKYAGYELRHVVNLTDVDDNTIRNSQAAGMPLRAYTDQYIEAFLIDRQLLNMEDPEFLVRATDCIPEMARLIQALVDRGFAYPSDGSVYFKVAAFPPYGQLAHVDFSAVRAGARVDTDKYDKENARDFVLWKAAKEGEPFWETPFGPGRPGWHIECSAMSMKYLGETFDIHSGGSDLIFPHHENEIAQSEAATGKPFVKVWMHAEHLIVNGEKMSKSLGNFYTLRDLIHKGYKPTAVRYLLTSVPHRKPLNFSFDGLHQAQQSIDRLRNFHFRLSKENFPAGENLTLQNRAQEARHKFEAALDDNLNTAEALGAIFDMVRDGNTAMDRREFRDGDRGPFLATLERWDRVFAVLDDDDHAKLVKFGFVKPSATAADSVGGVTSTEAVKQGTGNGQPGSGLRETLSDEEIEKLIAERAAARLGGDYARSDEIRANLLKAGVILDDTKAGARWKRK
ncbi:MAG TPA: cysteine--tRNA ligase [Terriglobia bacterium]|nr:cysteine--tRNA ligase [Terriglobia bacterium]